MGVNSSCMGGGGRGGGGGGGGEGVEGVGGGVRTESDEALHRGGIGFL